MSGKFALIIGNTEYTDPGLAQLSAPGKDAEDFARVLRDREIGAFDEVSVLLNQPSYTINEAIDEFFDQKKPDDLLVLYFSGHGVRDEVGALYLAVKNTNRLRLRATAIKSDYVRESMDQSHSKRQLLILDCCNSGAFTQGTKAATGVSIGTASAFEGGYGRIILTASDSTQFAWEGDKVIGKTDNSLFTHYLVKGLEGEADQDGDGRITVDELYDYAYEKVRFATPKQTPSKFSSKQQGEIVLRQSTRIENIKPVPLPTYLTDAIESPDSDVRLGAIQSLSKLLTGKNIGLARSAKEALGRIAAEDDSRRVSQAATQVLDAIRQIEQKSEEEQKAREEAERLAILKAEEKRLAYEKIDAERKSKEEAEKLARAQAERKVAEAAAARFKAEREAAERATREAVEKAAKEKVEKEAAEREAARLETEQEATREKAERDVAQKAEREAMKLTARKKSEREAAEKAEREAKEKNTKSPAHSLRPAYLTWGIIGIIGICVIVAGAWGVPYLASLGTPAQIESQTPTKAPSATEFLPTTELVSATPPESVGIVNLQNILPAKRWYSPIEGTTIEFSNDGKFVYSAFPVNVSGEGGVSVAGDYTLLGDNKIQIDGEKIFNITNSVFEVNFEKNVLTLGEIGLYTLEDDFAPLSISDNPSYYQAYLGYWENKDANTSIPALYIFIDDLGLLQIHGWGVCHPDWCDWGVENAKTTDKFLYVFWDSGFSRKHMALQLVNQGELRMQTVNHFTDSSGRSDYSYNGEYRKSTNATPTPSQ